jgi:site-specific DNA recombinase
MRKTALYIRKSTTTKQANSTMVQLDAMHSYCEGTLDVQETFEDHQTGRNLERPGLKSALSWLSEDPTRVLVFYKVDRYGRTLDDFQNIRHFIDNDQTRFMDTQGPSDRADMVMIQIKLVLAENESRLMGNRISATIRHLQKNGRTWGGDVQHMIDMRQRSADVRSSNADDFALTILDWANRLDTLGIQTLSAKVETLNNLNIQTRTGKTWNNSGLHRVLKRAELINQEAA